MIHDFCSQTHKYHTRQRILRPEWYVTWHIIGYCTVCNNKCSNTHMPGADYSMCMYRSGYIQPVRAIDVGCRYTGDLKQQMTE